MTEYEKIYDDIANLPDGPYIRLLTIHSGKYDPDAMKLTKPEEDWSFTWDDDIGDFKPVKPADWSDEPAPSDLEVELSVHSLNSYPEYEALSYTWGKETDYKFNIKCNGHNFIALRQMHNAVLALRLPDRPRVLWIDAICINQSKYEDKNCQLPLMQHIYRNSKRTVVWLGMSDEKNHAPAFKTQADQFGLPPPSLDDFVFSLEKFLAINLDTLATDPGELWQDHAEVKPTWERRLDLIKDAAQRVKDEWATRENPPSADFNTAINELMAATAMPKLLRSAGKYILTRPKHRNDVRQGMATGASWRETIRNLLCREWWSRVWIIQEVCLAPELLFICDNTTFNLDLLFLGMVLYSVFPDDPLFRGHILSSWTLPQVMEYRTLQRQTGNRPLPGFLHLLGEFRLSDATNPRDHVYALLGLVPPDNQAALDKSNYSPDYGKDIAWCYTETAKAICSIHDNLDILSISRAPARVASTSPTGPLPSWVPDWAVKVGVPSPKHGIESTGAGDSASLFSACGTCTSWTPDIRNDGNLVISGYAADTITEVVSHVLPFMTDFMDAVMKLMNGEDEPDKEALEQLADGKGMMDYMMGIFAGIGSTLSVLIEWEEFVLSGDRGVYPTGENIKDVACAVRCFGYMPDGLEAAVSAFNEYMNAFKWTRRMYNLTSSSTSPSAGSKLSLPFFKSKMPKDKENSGPSKLSQSLVGLSIPKDKTKMIKFNSLQSFSLGRKLAWTEKGYLALVHEDTTVGDKVVLCKGSKLPLLMRPEGEANQWKLLDCCYVHGIMGGEAWDESLCGEMELV